MKHLKIFFLLGLLFVTSISFSKDKEKSVSITGRVTDTNGEPIAGASIEVEGSTTLVYTDLDGMFQLQRPVSGKLCVHVSTIAYKERTMEIDPTAVKGKDEIVIALEGSDIF